MRRVVAQAVDLARHGERLDELPVSGVVEGHLLAARADAQHTSIEIGLRIADVAGGGQSLRHGVGSSVPDAHVLLGGNRDNQIVIACRQHIADAALVILQQCGIRIRTRQIEDAQLLLRTARVEARAVCTEAHTLNDVFVLQCVQLCTRQGVPQLRTEIGSGSRGLGGGRVQTGAPNGAWTTRRTFEMRTSE